MGIEKSEINKKYLLVFLLIALATFPFFKGAVGFYLMLVVLLFNFAKLKFKTEALLFLGLVTGLEIYHNIAFKNYDILATKTLIYYFVVSILVIYYVKLDILNIYIKILYYFTLISFPFFILYYLDRGLAGSFMDSVPSVFVSLKKVYGDNIKQVNPIFYNFDYNYLNGRNNGPFWEPAVFAIMLIIAQIFNYLTSKSLFNKVGIVFTIGLITTLSTTGYFAYAILIVGSVMVSKKINTVFKIILMGSLLFVSFSLFNNVSFLSKKINAEIDRLDYDVNSYGGNSRIGSAVLDIAEVSQENIYMLLGKGSSKNSRIGGSDKDVLRNCGDTAVVVEWGIPFALLYLGLLYFSFYHLCGLFQVSKFFSLIFTAIFLILGFSEVIFDLPFFHCFLFMGFIVKRYYQKRDIFDGEQPTLTTTISV